MTAYKASFNQFEEMIFGSGVVIRRIERPGGTWIYSQTITPSNDRGIDIDKYMSESGEWYEVDDDEAAHWMKETHATVTASEAAQIVSLTSRQIRYHIESKSLPAVWDRFVVPARWLIFKSDLLAWAEKERKRGRKTKGKN